MRKKAKDVPPHLLSASDPPTCIVHDESIEGCQSKSIGSALLLAADRCHPDPAWAAAGACSGPVALEVDVELLSPIALSAASLLPGSKSKGQCKELVTKLS